MDSARTEHSRNLRRRGAVVLAVFALLWAAVAASGLPSWEGWAVRIAGVLVSATAVLIAVRRTGTGAAERPRRQPEGWYRRVGLVNGAQFVAIALVVVVLIVTGVPQLVPPVVCLIVGLHFIPLARLFDQPQYTWTGVGLCVAAMAGLALLGVGSSQEASRIVVGSLAAITLWATSVQLTLRG